MSSSGPFPSRPLWSLTPLALACLIVSGETLGVDGRPNESSSQVAITDLLGSESSVMPSSVFEGGELTLRQKGSLGEILNGLPGVSSIYFGPGASRPVIRGMDGNRIRLLHNGAGTLDTSPLSYDHTVPEDPNSVECLEVVRGPVTPLYGGNAIGGIVNSFDSRTPSEPVDGIHGSDELRYGDADTTHSCSGALEASNGNFTLYVDAASREFNDARIPGYTHSNHQRQIDDDTGRHRMQNSGGRQGGSTVGGSYHWKYGYAGLPYGSYDGNYDSSAEGDVCLKMQQGRYASTSEIRDPEGPFTSLRLDAAYTKHEHGKIEGGETGTIFKSEGHEGHIEARHRPLGPLNGVIGAQFVNSRFSVLDEEALVSYTEANSATLFALEEWKLSDRLDLSFGTHLERTRVGSGTRDNERSVENDGSQSLTTGSLSTGAVYKPTSIWSLAATLGYIECAPAFYGLRADGPHIATDTYEVGDVDADKEKAVPTDLTLRFDNGARKGSVGVFYSRFSNYIGLLVSDRHHNEESEVVVAGDDEALPEYLYSGIRADSYDAKAQDRIHPLESPYDSFDLELSGDYTHAENKDAGKPLPRIAPLRLNTTLVWESQQQQVRVDVKHAAPRYRVLGEEPSTGGYTTLDASLGYDFDLGESHQLTLVKGINLTNQTVRYAGSTLRDRVPTTERGIEAGVKVAS